MPQTPTRSDDKNEYDDEKGLMRTKAGYQKPAGEWVPNPERQRAGSSLGPGGFKAGSEPDYASMTDEDIEKMSPLARAGARAKRAAARRAKEQGAKKQGAAVAASPAPSPAASPASTR